MILLPRKIEQQIRKIILGANPNLELTGSAKLDPEYKYGPTNTSICV